MITVSCRTGWPKAERSIKELRSLWRSFWMTWSRISRIFWRILKANRCRGWLKKLDRCRLSSWKMRIRCSWCFCLLNKFNLILQLLIYRQSRWKKTILDIQLSLQTWTWARWVQMPRWLCLKAQPTRVLTIPVFPWRKRSLDYRQVYLQQISFN